MELFRSVPFREIMTTAPSECKVGNEIDFMEFVYLMNVTLLRVAIALI